MGNIIYCDDNFYFNFYIQNPREGRSRTVLLT